MMELLVLISNIALIDKNVLSVDCQRGYESQQVVRNVDHHPAQLRIRDLSFSTDFSKLVVAQLQS